MASSGSFLFVTWAGGGNVHPLMALAARTRARGHRVRGLADAALTKRFAAEGITLRAHRSGETWFSANSGATSDDRDAFIRSLADDLIDEAGREPTDALVVDFMQPEALCAAERTGLPYVAFVHTLYTRFALLEPGPMNILTDIGAISRLRAGLALAPIERTPDLLANADRIFIVTARDLDRPRADIPANARYAGPLVEDAGADAGWKPPMQSDAPMVVIGLGTTPMDEAPVLNRILDALSGLPVRVLATVGDHLDPANVAAPANAAVSRYIRHAAILPHARLFIGHAGLSGIGAAMTFGVPMLCVPLGRDQPLNAAHVEKIGLGRTVPPGSSVDELQAAASAVLADDAMFAAARAMGAAIRASDPVASAVSELESLLPA